MEPPDRRRHERKRQGAAKKHENLRVNQGAAKKHENFRVNQGAAKKHENFRVNQGAAKKDEKPIQQSPAKVKETSGRESRRVHPSGPVGTLKHLRKIALGCIRYWQSLQVAHDSASCNCTLNKEKSRY